MIDAVCLPLALVLCEISKPKAHIFTTVETQAVILSSRACNVNETAISMVWIEMWDGLYQIGSWFAFNLGSYCVAISENPLYKA